MKIKVDSNKIQLLVCFNFLQIVGSRSNPSIGGELGHSINVSFEVKGSAQPGLSKLLQTWHIKASTSKNTDQLDSFNHKIINIPTLRG